MRNLLLAVFLLLPSLAFAQEATLSGTVTDTTGGVLPGVTITVYGAPQVDKNVAYQPRVIQLGFRASF